MHRTLAWILCAFCITACRDAAREPVISPTPAGTRTTASLALEYAAPGDTTRTVVLRLSPGEGVGKIGSLTAAIDIDTTKLAFIRDESPNDGAMRAVKEDHGRIRLVVASAAGIEPSVVVRLRVRTKTSGAAEAMKLTISELHQVDATDILRSVVVSSPSENR